jgi:hypothetical protein
LAVLQPNLQSTLSVPLQQRLLYQRHQPRSHLVVPPQKATRLEVVRLRRTLASRLLVRVQQPVPLLLPPLQPRRSALVEEHQLLLTLLERVLQATPAVMT